jgi:hypothetical protein
MAIFDPSKHKNSGDSEGVPAGDYLLILKNFERKTGKNSHKPYFRGCFEVIHGPAKGGTFFDSISLDVTNSGAMFRLSMLSEQCGAGPFDLDSDRDIADALCRKPFKAAVNRERSGEYTNNGIKRYLGDKITEFEQRVMETWLIEEAERNQFGGGDSGGGYDENGLDAPPPPGDDDIPF